MAASSAVIAARATRLALGRTTMLSGVPRRLPAAAAPVRHLLDLSWIVHDHDVDGSQLLMLRDPELG